MAGHVEDTVPYPESGQNEKKHHPDRNDYRPETGKKTETESELDRGKWMSTLKKKTFIVGVALLVKWTLLFAHFLFNHHLSHVTAFCIKHE